MLLLLFHTSVGVQNGSCSSHNTKLAMEPTLLTFRSLTMIAKSQ